MAYRSNPFSERASERTTSDQEFVQLFSPKILERLPEDCLEGGVHVFRSSPGGGKTTIMRAFTPNALRAFWHAKKTQAESYRQLVERGVIDDDHGPETLGVQITCAAGYADLPPGASQAREGLFRALLDCRTVLRALRSLGDLISLPASELGNIELEYDTAARELTAVPLGKTAQEMIAWAEQRERDVYGQLDSILPSRDARAPTHLRFESILWLQSVRFKHDGRSVAPKRLLMIDDTQSLRKSQRALLISELVNLRPAIPVWLATRSIAFGDNFLSQGAREGRDIREYLLEEIWASGRAQFASFAQNILDRRFALQSIVPGNSFSQYLVDSFTPRDLETIYKEVRERFTEKTIRYRDNIKYKEWLERADQQPDLLKLDTLIDLYVTRILIARSEGSKQLSLELAPLPKEELVERDNSAVQGAAEIMLNRDFKLPYYYGLDRLCAMATNNVEELLGLAAALYEGMKAKQVLRRQTQPELLPSEQEKRLREAAERKRDFIPRNHTEGAKAQRLLDSVGIFCREKTFLLNAPYAPGVTGVRLAFSEIEKLVGSSKKADAVLQRLTQVLFECVAENLLVTRESSASSSREGGLVFYLNRTLCARYGLPLQYGGWQDVTVQRLTDWMQTGLQP
ncbi:MAG TPA: hypothetical protein VEC99_08190, partial [Clostridia bacterium]|nr:hypothetical protein [Clostridia bacterium]